MICHGASSETGCYGRPVHVHHVCRGRVRFAVNGLKRSPRLAELMIARLGEINGVKLVRANPLTGNVIIHFDPEAISNHELLRAATGLVEGGFVPAGSAAGAAAWHTMSVHAVAQSLMTSAQTGLPPSAAHARLIENGKNVISAVHTRSSAGIIADQLKSFPVAVLAGAAVISFATGALLECLAISAVIALNTAIGYVSESRAERVLSSLEAERAPLARVVRQGEVRQILAEDLVPGDIILLQRGDVVPADARLIQVAGLSVSESPLTGESLPVSKTVEAIPHIHDALAERTNMIYRGTVAVGGSAAAIVVATGARTEIGRVQRLVVQSRAPQTPMQQQLDQLGRNLVWITALAGLALVVIGLLRGRATAPILRSALTMCVAAIPEGLPMVATTALAIGVERMRRSGMIVRRLNAVETLASVDVVCFDKTGTLTLNRMKVTELAGAERRVTFAELANLSRTGLGRDLRRLLEVACLCSEVELGLGDDGNLKIEGSPTETALVNAAIEARLDPRQIRSRYPLVRIQHRSEAYRFMATLHHAPTGSLVAVKGDPDEVASRCEWVLGSDGAVRPMTEEQRTQIGRLNQDLARRALRVLGFAFDEPIGRSENMTLEGLTWVGLAGLADPVRSGVSDVLKRLEKAGVRSVMLTGDSVMTARAVATEIGLGNNGNNPEVRVMKADEFAQLDAETRAREAARIDVFARVSPAQKLEIVHDLQRSGAVVAMLGDGINDSPALRAADVGLAVGRGGDAAAREVADIYLENEDLSLLLAGIEQGRGSQESVQRALRFLLSTNISEVLLLVAAAAIGRSEPLSPAQLLWINLLTDVLPGIALTFEPHEHGLVERGPTQPDLPIIGSGHVSQLIQEAALLASVAIAAGLFVSRTQDGQREARSQTVTFASLVASQLLHALNCRPRRVDLAGKSSMLNRVVYGSLAVQGAAAMLPTTRLLLGLAPMTASKIVVIAASAVLSFLAIRHLMKDLSHHGEPSKLHFVRQKGKSALSRAPRVL